MFIYLINKTSLETFKKIKIMKFPKLKSNFNSKELKNKIVYKDKRYKWNINQNIKFYCKIDHKELENNHEINLLLNILAMAIVNLIRSSKFKLNYGQRDACLWIKTSNI
jgi:hypothetical protein